MSSIDHARERALVGGLLWQLGVEGQERWEACRSSHRFMAFVGKQLIVFTFGDDLKPVLKDRLTLSSLSMASDSGVASHWTNSHGNLIKVGHTPTEIAPSVFLWHTFDSNLQYVPYKGVYNLRTSMLFKSEHNVAYPRIGPHYILEWQAYQQEFGL